jgi:hypothetical protein
MDPPQVLVICSCSFLGKEQNPRTLQRYFSLYVSSSSYRKDSKKINAQTKNGKSNPSRLQEDVEVSQPLST